MAKLLITGAMRNPSEAFIAKVKQLNLDIVYLQNELVEVIDDMSDVEAVICNSLFRYTDISHFPSLKFINATSAGLDRLPLERIAERGIKLFNARGVYSVPMAEWALCSILSIYKGVRGFMRSQDRCEWNKNRNIRELSGSSAVVLGFGSVGQECAKRLSAMGVSVDAVDVAEITMPYINHCYKIEELADVIGSYDIVVLTLPLTPQTTHLIDAEMLKRFKRDATLVNISRGAVVDEPALVDALSSGALFGAALDVFEVEPLAEESPLWGMDNVIVTPHNSFVSERNAERLEEVIINNLRGVLKTDPVI